MSKPTVKCSKCQVDLKPQRDNVCEDCHARAFSKEVKNVKILIMGEELNRQTRLAEELEHQNFELRYLLWLNHGHKPSTYREGEFWCADCKLNYKTAPFKAIIKREGVKS
ncbi:MAG: hypothetical protein ACYSW3_00425 [Planctomycetota bacterium]